MLTVADLLAEEDDVRRNEIALELSQSKDPDVFKALIELVHRPELSNSRGTLVYCLGNFDCSGIFLTLVDLLLRGNWEVAHEAAAIMFEIDKVDGENAKKGYEMLSRAMQDKFLEGWRISLVKEALELFD